MTNDHIIQQIDILRIKDHQTIHMQDQIIDEDILKIFINGCKSFEIVFSMTHTEALAAGFLFTQGIVKTKNDIKNIRFDESLKQCDILLGSDASGRLDVFRKKQQVKGSSGGMLLGDRPADTLSQKTFDIRITPKQVLHLIDAHWQASGLFHRTGAVHSAGLCTREKILSYYEDIGRHNALDKLAGSVLLKGIDPNDKIATLSCRMSLEIIGKLVKTGIPIVISNAAPTLSAVNLARQAGLTIIGFARERRFNIYTHEKRVLYPGA